MQVKSAFMGTLAVHGARRYVNALCGVSLRPVNGYPVVIQYDPEIELFRGEFTGLDYWPPNQGSFGGFKQRVPKRKARQRLIYKTANKAMPKPQNNIKPNPVK